VTGDEIRARIAEVYRAQITTGDPTACARERDRLEAELRRVERVEAREARIGRYTRAGYERDLAEARVDAEDGA